MNGNGETVKIGFTQFYGLHIISWWQENETELADGAVMYLKDVAIFTIRSSPL